MNRITDKSFVYTPSFDTDLKKKFRLIIEREKRFQRERKRAEVADAKTSQGTVVPITAHSGLVQGDRSTAPHAKQ
jgi:hypothetical protein